MSSTARNASIAAFLSAVGLGLAIAVLYRVNDTTSPPPRRPMAMPKSNDVPAPDPGSSEEKWKSQLTPEQYHVTREKGTERAFTGKYWNHKSKGIYKCVCCGNPLFDSATKFDSGTGWPSFTAPIDEEHVKTSEDKSLFMSRTEVVCQKCGAHLGHVFDDGPRPTGLRYCINSASLDFAERDPATETPK